MTEILFYHLDHQRVENVLPTLLERSLARGWRAAVQAASDDRVDSLDAHLWTYRDDGFLPHGTDRENTVALQPVLLTTSSENRNRADVRFLIDGVSLPADVASYTRVVLIFDGADADAVAGARTHWTAAKADGHDVTYWQPDAQGRWQRKA